MGGPDHRLRVPVVVEGAAQRLDARGQRGLAHHAGPPNLVEQLLLGHDPAPLAGVAPRAHRRPGVRPEPAFRACGSRPRLRRRRRHRRHSARVHCSWRTGADDPHGVDGRQRPQLVGDHPDAADAAAGQGEDVDHLSADRCAGRREHPALVPAGQSAFRSSGTRSTPCLPRRIGRAPRAPRSRGGLDGDRTSHRDPVVIGHQVLGHTTTLSPYLSTDASASPALLRCPHLT